MMIAFFPDQIPPTDRPTAADDYREKRKKRKAIAKEKQP